MSHIEFFKLQAKNLFKDYQTKKKSPDAAIGDYEYDPKYFDIEGIILHFDIDEEDFSLMKAQHIIAQIVGFFPDESPPDQCKAIIKKKAGRDSSLK